MQDVSRILLLTITGGIFYHNWSFFMLGRSGGECALGAGCQREHQQTNLPWSGYLHKEQGQQPIEEKRSYNSGSAAHENDSGYTYVWNMI